MKCSTLLRNQKYKTEEFKTSCTPTLLKKKIPKLRFCLLAVLILTKIHVYKVVLKVDMFHHLCCNKPVSN